MGSGVSYLDRFFRPRSVAIIGLSRSAVGSPVSVLTTLREFGYAGRIHIVNPSMAAVEGAEVHADLAAIADPVDLAIVTVERSGVPKVLEECAASSIPAAVVITQGFADADEEGAALQQAISEIIARTGIRVIGPNTVGVVNSLDRFTSSFIEVSEDRVPIGQIAQSGFLMMGHHLITNEKAGYCMAADLGNACDVGLIDILRYFEEAPEIDVIECHVEAIEDGGAFLETASRISLSKPIVALKAGTTEMGGAAVASHTGAVAGQARVYEAAFRQAGIVQADTAEELRLLSKAFSIYTPPEGRRVAVMSFSGGGAVLSIDALDRAGLELATLSEDTQATIRELFPPWMEVANPVDVWIPVSKDLHTAFPLILEKLLRDEGVDAVICIYCSYNLPKYDRFDASSHIRDLAARYPQKPVLCWSYGQDIEGVTRKIEAARTAMVFPTLASAADTLSRLVAYAEWKRKAEAAGNRPAPGIAPRPDAVTIIETAREAGREYLFTEAFDILAGHDLPLAPWAFVTGESDVETKAKSLSGPLCLKVVSDDVVHKSDAGGVMVGVGKAELRQACTAMTRAVKAGLPDAHLDGFVVQEMVRAQHEVMIGVIRDPSFGPCVAFGAGGIYAELLDDFAFRVAPFAHGDAMDMIAETRISKILSGARGRKPADLSRIADMLVKIGDLACAYPDIEEIDLNPVFITDEGPIIVDVRFILSPGGAGGKEAQNLPGT